MLTFSCYRRGALLVDEPHRLIVARALEAAFQKHGWLLNAFVFMPEHVHLLCVPWAEGASGAEDLLYAIKRPASSRVKLRMLEEGDPRLEGLTILERPGKWCFRFWQEGPGHDRNIRDGDELGAVIEYIHKNPVKRGLCASPEEWVWSSARQYVNLPVSPEVPRVIRWSWGRGLELEPWGER